MFDIVILVDVLDMVVPAVKKLSKDDSHLTTLPVIPLKVNTVLFEPEQTFILPLLIVPLDPLPTFICLVKIVTLDVKSPGMSPYSQI